MSNLTQALSVRLNDLLMAFTNKRVFIYSGNTWGAKLADTAALSQALVYGLINSNTLPAGFVWLDQSLTAHSFTFTTLVALSNGMGTFLTALVAVYYTHIANINALTVASDVWAYDITTGWPDPTIDYFV